MITMRIAALLGALMAAATAGEAAAEPLKLRIQWANVTSHMTPLIPEAPKEIYRHYGKSYTVEPIFIAGSGPAMTAIAANEADMGGLAPQTMLLGIVEAKLDLRLIGQQSAVDIPGYSTNGFWVRAAEIGKIEELRGKTIAVNARGGAVDATAMVVLGRHGMKPDKDYQFVELRFPAMFPALESKKVDAAFLVAPHSLMVEKMPAYRRLFTTGDAFGPSDNLSWVAKAEFVAKNRAVLVDFLEDNIRLRRWAYDPATRMDAVRAIAKLAKQPTDAFEEWVYTRKDVYREPHALVDIDRFQKNIDDLHAVGLAPARIDIRPHIDMSLAKEAAARVGTM